MTYVPFTTSGNDYINYTGSDNLWADGGYGNDFIWGNTGNDTIYGGSGNDTLQGYSGNDWIYGGDDADLIMGEDGYDTLYGGNGSDSLYGGNNNDSLYGGSAGDYLNGGAGNDFLDGYSGGYEWQIDTLTGGAGSDTFVLGRYDGDCYLGGSSGGTDSNYALITDWDPSADYIQVHWNTNYYHFGYGNWVGGSATDTGIYLGNDLLAVVQDSTNVSFSRDFISFGWVNIDNGTNVVLV